MRPTVNIIDQKRYRLLYRLLKQVNQFAPYMAALSDEDLQAKTKEFKQRLKEGATLDELLPEAFAAMREANKRILGQYPYDVQVMGGIVLHQGKIAEMKTGEGKTLSATLPLYLNALTGKSTILVTANDYLAKRDAAEMGAVFRFMDLSVGVGIFDKDDKVTADDRRRVYASDVVYTTSAALGFDYLAENLAGSSADKFLSPFQYVIVDEADAVLLDGAQTPLIVSGSPRVQSNLYKVCNQFVTTLKKEEYFFNEEKKYLYLTGKGVDYAEHFFNIPDLYDVTYFELNRHIHLALQAHHFYKRNRDYVVEDDEVKLLDNRTGRILEGTRLQAGLHQAIEAKEGVKMSKENRSMASVTYQSLFNMFPKLAGMTGTGKVVEDELIDTYCLEVVVIPTNLPIKRVDYPDRLYTTLPEKLVATLELVKEIHTTGQPILLVSGTVEIAEVYSNMLLQEGIAHNTLTASNIAKEALIIQEAGQKGAVTVATTLAGRGTDIKLGKGVAELGGLAVIGTEKMQNRRFDGQIRGRAGRQGDPGMSVFFASLEDHIILKYGSNRIKRYFEKHSDNTTRSNYGQPLKARRFHKALRQAQLISEDSERQGRQSTVAFDTSVQVQRKAIYEQRDRLIFNEEPLSKKMDTIVKEAIASYAYQKTALSYEGLSRYILENYSYGFQSFPESFKIEDRDAVYHLLWELYQAELAHKQSLVSDLSEFYRLSVLRAIDGAWIEQVDNLQQLRNIVSTRQIAQRDTLKEYHKEAYMSYLALGSRIKEQIVRNIMLSTISVNKEGQLAIYFV